MHYVYLIRSLTVPAERYVGRSTNLKKRLQQHNAGESTHTSKFAPWELVTYLAFSNAAKAEEFEHYLKQAPVTPSQRNDCGDALGPVHLPIETPA